MRTRLGVTLLSNVRCVLIRFSRSERGAALVELAVILPVLIIVSVGAAEYGRLYFTGIAVANAARAGAQFGTTTGNAVNFTGMAQAVLNDARDVAGVTATPAPTSFSLCPDGSAPIAGACAGYGQAPVFVKASAQKTITFLMKYPGMPASITVSRTAILRVQ